MAPGPQRLGCAEAGYVHLLPSTMRIAIRLHHTGAIPVSMERACQCFSRSVSAIVYAPINLRRCRSRDRSESEPLALKAGRSKAQLSAAHDVPDWVSRRATMLAWLADCLLNRRTPSAGRPA
jgi:hypothetical protein